MADDAAVEFVAAAIAALPNERELFGHPRGLGILAGTLEWHTWRIG